MRVQRVWMPDSGAESWMVFGDDHAPVAPVERWLAHLTVIERSSNTIKGYAHDLKDWFAFLQLHRLDWRRVQLEDLGGFLAWLRLPSRVRDGRRSMGAPRTAADNRRSGRAPRRTTLCRASRPVARQPDAVDTERRDATLRLTLNPRRTPARGPDGWTGQTPARYCCAPTPTRPRLGPGPSATSPRGFGPTVTIDR